MNTWKVLIVVGLFFAISLVAEAAVELKTSVDKEKAVLGDRIKLSVVLSDAKDLEIVFPEKPKDPGDFSFIGSDAMTSKQAGKGCVGRNYVFGIYSTGTHVLSPVEIRYRKPGGTWETVSSRQVPVDVQSVLTGEETDIKDIKGLAVFGSRHPWIIFFVILILVCGFIVWRFWHHRLLMLAAERELDVRSAHEIAYMELEKLRARELQNKERIDEFYVCLSGIVRRYLENRFSYRVPEMTTEEFLNHLKMVPDISQEHKGLLKKFLTQCDMVKFAKYGPTPLEALDSFKLAVDIVDQTRIFEVEDKSVENK